MSPVRIFEASTKSGPEKEEDMLGSVHERLGLIFSFQLSLPAWMLLSILATMLLGLCSLGPMQGLRNCTAWCQASWLSPASTPGEGACLLAAALLPSSKELMSWGSPRR